MKHFLTVFQAALSAIREPHLFETERGYQGALVGELQERLRGAAYPGDPIVEQEYQKTIPNHGIKIRPDVILHIPFERKTTKRRTEGNFVAMEIKVRATPVEADEDFASLEAMKTKLGYPVTIFLNVNSSETHAARCPTTIAAQTLCFAVRLVGQEPTIIVDRPG